jgi:hypothetical protein
VRLRVGGVVVQRDGRDGGARSSLNPTPKEQFEPNP